uniref:Uncharacterized protein n=1 Tax=Cacopsylla melanoneura TaxID=428564 RepID=A0A8D9FJ64_9HEMI
MPLFSNKFTTKSIPARKGLTSRGDQPVKINPADPVCVKLGRFKAFFHEGRWRADGIKEEDNFDNNLDLREKLRIAKEEINMLRVKEEILIDMVTDLTIQLEEKEKHGLNGLKSHIRP